MSDERTTARDHLFGLFLGAAYVVLLALSATDLGMSRDESFYYKAAESYGAWFEQLLDDPNAALKREAIDRAWRHNWEHPPLMKIAFAASWSAQKRWNLFPQDSLAFRFPGMLCGGFLLWLIYIWGTQRVGRGAGAFAAVAFALMPRVFYHSHLACFDIPITFMVMLTAYCYWRSLESRVWAVWCGVAFGLALATKHNSWILPGIFLIHFSFVRLDKSREHSFWWLGSMLTIGPLIFFATWPRLWYDTWSHLGAYLGFHFRHVHYTYAYFGVSYFKPPLPMSVPFVMTLFTVPLTIVLLALTGIADRWRALWPRAAMAATTHVDPRRTDVLWFGCLLAPLVVIAIPTSPIFGGTKHWLTAYPFLALFAGIGFSRISVALRSQWQRVWLSVPVATLLLLPSAVETAHSHPFGLSHYGVVAGGVPGAADYGMNRQFWGFTTGSLVDFFTEQLPRGGRVFICDTTRDAWLMLQRDGKLPKNIRATPRMADANLVLVHHEDHFAEVDYQAWVLFNSVRPIKVLTYDGVPIVSVYANPNRKPKALD